MRRASNLPADMVGNQLAEVAARWRAGQGYLYVTTRMAPMGGQRSDLLMKGVRKARLTVLPVFDHRLA